MNEKYVYFPSFVARLYHVAMKHISIEIILRENSQFPQNKDILGYCFRCCTRLFNPWGAGTFVY